MPGWVGPAQMTRGSWDRSIGGL
ncbi:hypothetical protein LINPERHAP1_LOCUS14366 [Linum perenne]